MTDTLKLLTMLAWAICTTGLTWYCMNIARQITYVTLADGRLVADGPFQDVLGGHETHELPHSHAHHIGLEVV